MGERGTKAWAAAKERAALEGFTFENWLFVNKATGWAVSSHDRAAGGGFFLIAPVGFETFAPAAKAAIRKTYRTRTAAMRAANRLSRGEA